MIPSARQETDTQFDVAVGLTPAKASQPIVERPVVRGKFLFTGEEKFWIKGVTYGTFRPGEDGSQFPEKSVVENDFAMMAANGINSVRTYLPPPTWLLDIARQQGLRVMVGLAWEQHIAFLDDRSLVKKIKNRIREGVRACAGHPAVLCFSIGNEIPASIVGWHGRKRIERFLKKLYNIARKEDPQALVTYVNFPTTEYLQLPFLDFQCFNVYLESQERLVAYLARLQNLVGEQPLVMAEIGLDSMRNGEQAQKESLDWQVRSAFAAGCAGAFVFAWTDEWYRGGHDIDDWDSGLTTRAREPKPALESVNRAFAEAPFPDDLDWPSVSVVVCSLNGSATIRDTMEGLSRLCYPDYEVIVVNDGSTDATPDIVSEYDVTLISTENRGLSNARNTGWQEARGEIIAYIDDDAYPDPDWLKYIAYTFMTTGYAGVGGPNFAPPGDGPIADCVANAPGRPVQVLLSDTEAEHIPGCNMAFKRSVLEAINGFDPRYRAAGDDVDLCWRIQARGWKIGFHAGALNWHHCRNSHAMYLKQQQGYGKAEALLEEKWPDKYNTAGHFTWKGRLYGKGITEAVPAGRWRIYQGQWGVAPFQSIYEPAPGVLLSIPLMPEWYVVCWVLAFLSLLGLVWQPLLWTIPILAIALTASAVQVVNAAMKAEFPTSWPGRFQRFKLRCLSAWLHALQPLARLIGRFRHGLTPWRLRTGLTRKFFGISKVKLAIWSERWRSNSDWLTALSEKMHKDGVRVVPGGDFDGWDLEARAGLLGGARLLMATEEHGGEKLMLRFSVRSLYSIWGQVVMSIFLVIGMIAFFDRAWVAATFLIGFSALLAMRMRFEAATSVAVFRESLAGFKAEVEGGAKSEPGIAQ
jgi:GT2 family glycosyltransferase